MEPFPHHYTVDANLGPSGEVELTNAALPPLLSAPPVELDGPGDRWSPESLLVAAVVDCFALTFRALAEASRLEWTGLRCHAEGTLDRVDRVTRFVEMKLSAELRLPAGGKTEIARRLLEKAERQCLVTRSLDLTVTLDARVTEAG